MPATRVSTRYAKAGIVSGLHDGTLRAGERLDSSALIVRFAVEANAYDRFMGRYSAPLAPLFADPARVAEGLRVLDVGCGPDLIRDLGGEMRRIADFLDVDIPTALWSEAVERCRFEAMKSQHEAPGTLNQAFSEGATAFFNLGTNGRWRAQLSEAQLRRHERLTAERLPEDAALWLEHGSLALGQRP